MSGPLAGLPARGARVVRVGASTSRCSERARAGVRAARQLPTPRRAAVAGHCARRPRNVPAARLGHRSQERQCGRRRRGLHADVRDARRRRARRDRRAGHARVARRDFDLRSVAGARDARACSSARDCGDRLRAQRYARHAPTAGSAAASRPSAHAGPATCSDRARGDPDHPANLGRLCSKGAALGETLGLEGRLLHPEIRGERASWDEALDVVAERVPAYDRSRTARTRSRSTSRGSY